jgi:SAM-dependent methyltransferase
MNLIFSRNIEKYIDLQCNGDKSLYYEFPELNSFKDIVDVINPRKILDIGSGIGRASVFLFKKFGWIESEFLLLDGDYGDKQLDGIRSDDGEFYNSFEATNEYCRINGMNSFRCIDASTDDIKKEIDIDLVYSFLSIGFHWSITLYLDRIYNSLSKGCILIFGIRGVEAKQWIEEQIDNINVDKYDIIRFVLKPTNTRESILVLRKK